MRAVILAAGVGRRMRPLSDETPKALLAIDGRPVLSWTVDSLVAAGVRSLVVVTGHRAELIERSLFETHPDLDIAFVRNPQFATTNTLASLLLALRHEPADVPTIVVEADVLCPESLIADLVGTDADDTTVVSAYQPSSEGTAVSVTDGEITEFFLNMPDDHAALEGKFKTVNVHRFSARLCHSIIETSEQAIDGIDDTSFYEAVLAHLTTTGRLRLRAQVVDPTTWIEVDVPNDVRIGRFRFEPDRRTDVVERAKGGFWGMDLLDFAHMTNRRFPPPRFRALLSRQLPDLLANYGSSQDLLDEKLSDIAGCPPERLLCLNGASQVYPVLAELFRGRPVVLPAPTFGEYERLSTEPLRYPDQVGWDIEDIGALAPDGAVVVFVNPNNPTGSTNPPELIHDYARANPTMLVVVDESFIDFAPVGSVLERLEHDRLDNVLVVSSLGKSIGMPGVRLGFAYTHDAALRSAIVERIPIWPVNSIAECVLELLPRFREELTASFAETVQDREAFSSALAGHDAIGHVHPSGGNFLLVDLADHVPSAAEIREALLRDHGILVKDVSDRFEPAEQRLRLAVRLPEENELLLTRLATVVDSTAAPA